MLTTFYRDDFVLLTDDSKSWIVRIEDISLLEAWRNGTLVHFQDAKLLTRRSLGHYERRLDNSIFFRPTGAALSTSAMLNKHDSSKMKVSFFC